MFDKASNLPKTVLRDLKAAVKLGLDIPLGLGDGGREGLARRQVREPVPLHPTATLCIQHPGLPRKRDPGVIRIRTTQPMDCDEDTQLHRDAAPESRIPVYDSMTDEDLSRIAEMLKLHGTFPEHVPPPHAFQTVAENIVVWCEQLLVDSLARLIQCGRDVIRAILGINFHPAIDPFFRYFRGAWALVPVRPSFLEFRIYDTKVFMEDLAIVPVYLSRNWALLTDSSERQLVPVPQLSSPMLV
ncbi:hypothetical protein BS47DRAFT_1398109 [Hydnum rufescens UP504]|uniref:Uncharacterized protein n=1 Tax=Hydnum rufescens UP504 TaxID=1448309 RepID=A0A9P6DRY3_9AGAM|nr:hypothetical protein BS47DRAFT_1398109 [Hydnum rufescens UP504]